MSHHDTSGRHENETAIPPLPPEQTRTAPTETVLPLAPPDTAGAARYADERCSYCDEPVGPSRYRDGDLRLCRPCGVIARMSGKQRTDQLRHHLTGDLLRRVALLSTEATHRNLESAFGWEPHADTAALFAGVATDALIRATLHSGAHVPLIADEIGRRGAAHTFAEQAGWTDSTPLPINAQAMVRRALELDDTLTAAQLAQVADSRFRGAVVSRVGELDEAATAELVARLTEWEAYRLAELGTAPVGLLTSLAERDPSVAGAVVRDPRATPETLATIAAHHNDPTWWRAAAATLGHANVDVTLMPVPLLTWAPEPRGRMTGYLDGHLGIGTPKRRTAGRLADRFAGTLAQLLLVVAGMNEAPAG
ncbi:hypothetical protein ACU610_21410 [Geodermatophilus sp. URMC 61]|uniref:hypothetical protein n=1 Tax=Geodermatophilus sp. URMC 61 TaxID=3423411 RepID=UPI00406D46B2